MGVGHLFIPLFQTLYSYSKVFVIRGNIAGNNLKKFLFLLLSSCPEFLQVIQNETIVVSFLV